MKIKVTQKFIDHRTDKAGIYNQRGRSDRQFLMDLDAEIYEWDKLNHWEWREHDSWMVDAYDEWDRKIDVKFIRGFWMSQEKRPSTLLSSEMYWMAISSWNGSSNRPVRCRSEMKSKFDKWGFLSLIHI